MPQRQTKFSETWLSSVDSNGQRIGEWCRKGQNEYQAYCQFCDVQVKCDNAGKTQLLQHSKQKKHIDAIKPSVDKKQKKLVAFSKQSGESSACSSQSLGLITPGDSMNAEIFWLAKVSVSNLNLQSVDNIGDLFRAMFPDSKIAANFKLSHTSASYMIADGMSKYFTQLIVKDLVKSKLPFCIHFDETTSTQVKKQMDLTLRYWSPTHEEVWITYYTSLFFGHAEGEKVAVKMYEQLVSDGIPVAQLVTLVRDGPNVNKTMFRKMDELIRHDNPEFTVLVDLGSCSIHTIHNAFGKGLEKCGKEIEQLCMDLHALFKYSAARREDFREVQIEMDLDLTNFLQHTVVRWLSIGPAVKRILEQWEAVTQFVTDLAKDPKKLPRSINFKRVHMMLYAKEKMVTRVLLEFLNDVIPIFEQFLLLFQRASPVIHIMYDSMCDILVRLLRRFMKGQAVEKRYGSDITSIECQDVKHQLPDKSIVIGKGAREALVKLTSEQQRQALLGIRSFMCTTATELQQKLPLKNELLRQLGCTNPNIERLTAVLQPEISTSEVIDEWKLFQVDNELSDYNQQERIEKYWNAVFQLQSSDGQLRYKLLPAVIKSALTLGQTNAESECSLSVNAAIVTRERTLLSENTIIGLRVVKEAVRFFDPVSNQPEKIAITDDLRRFVRNAHAAYKERLERMKRKKDEVQRMKEISEKAKKEKERLLEKKKSLELTEDNLNEQEEKARQKLSVADELLKDATSKLDSALASKPINTNSITATKMMLETASVKREEAMDELDEIRKRRKSLDKSTHKPLDQALPSKETSKSKRKLESEEKSQKKLKK